MKRWHAASLLGLLLLVLVVVAGCDREYLSKREAESEMKKIAKAAIQFKNDYARPPQDVQELIDADLLIKNLAAFDRWQFEINWPDEIVAFSTEKMPGGPGKILKYKIPQKY